MEINRVKAEHIPPEKIFGKFSRSKWKLTRSLKMLNGIVPKGFVSDGVTIPFWLFFIAKPTGTMLEPAIWHDYALSLLELTESRDEADNQFREEGYRYGVDPLRVETLYYTVKIFGKLKVAYHRRFK